MQSSRSRNNRQGDYDRNRRGHSNRVERGGADRGARSIRANRMERFQRDDRAARSNRVNRGVGRSRRGNEFQEDSHRTMVAGGSARRRGSSSRANYGYARDYARSGSAGSPSRAEIEREREYAERMASHERHGRSRSERRPKSDVYVRDNQQRGLFAGHVASRSGSNGHRGVGRSMGSSIRAGFSLPMMYAAPVAIFIAIIVLMVLLLSVAQSCSTPVEQQDPIAIEEPEPMTIAYQPSILALDSVPTADSTVTGFTLASEGQNYMPSLSEEGQTFIQNALAPFNENEYDVGFVMLDLQTGSGYAYNPNLDVYGASSIKGPVLLYGCEEVLEPGTLSIDSVNETASQVIINSDNNAYYDMRSLFEEYGDISLTKWLTDMNIGADVESDTSFPHYCARDSAKMWMNGYLYFTSSDSDPEIVSWAQDLFSQTEVSMLRAGVDPTFPLKLDEDEVYITAPGDSPSGGLAAGGVSADQSSSESTDSSDSADQSSESSTDSSADQSDSASQSGESGISAADTAQQTSNVMVYDKAGWLNGEEDDGLCDAGIVIEDGKAYLISVMSGAPDSDDNRQAVANLIAALWSQRSSLAPSQGYTTIAPSQSTNQSGDSSSEGTTDQGQSA